MQEQKTTHIAFIDFLRFISMIVVFLSHYYDPVIDPGFEGL